MDAAQQVDDHRAGGGILGGLILTEKHISQQHAKAWPRVGLQHVHDGFSRLRGLGRRDGGKDAVIDGVV